MRVSYDQAQRAYDNEGPEDYEFRPITDEERGEEAENQANQRDEE